MKYHYQIGLKNRWGFGMCLNGLALAGWLLLLTLFIDMMLFDGRLLTNLLTL